MTGFRLHFPDFARMKVRPDDAVKIRLPWGSADVEIPVLADVVPVSVSRFLQRDFLDGLSRYLRIKLAQITAIASSPDESVGSKSLVVAGSCPLCDLPCRRVQHSEVIGPRLGENNFAIIGYCQPVLPRVFSGRDRNRIFLHDSGAGIELS